MELVRKDWNELDDKREIEILDKYARMMHTYTIVFIRKRQERCLLYRVALTCIIVVARENIIQGINLDVLQ